VNAATHRGAALLSAGFLLLACRGPAADRDVAANDAAPDAAAAADPYEIHKQRFLEFSLRKDYDAALAEAAAALEAAPTRREAYMLVSKTFIDTGRDRDGISFFKAVAEKNPSHADPWFFKGFHEGRLGLWADARGSLQRAVALAPDDPEGHFRLGQVLEQQADLEGAQKELRRSCELDPRSAAKTASLMRVLSASGRNDEADRIAAALLGRAPDTAEAEYAVATLRLQQKRWREAEGALRRVLALEPRFAPARADLVRLLLQSGRKAEAEEELARAQSASETPSAP